MDGVDLLEKFNDLREETRRDALIYCQEILPVSLKVLVAISVVLI